MSEDRKRRFHLWGWGLFVGCAVFYVAAALRDGDVLSLVGGVLFFLACLVFLVPLLKGRDG